MQTARITPCGKYQDPITYGDNFLKFGRDEENREPIVRQIAKIAQNLLFGANVADTNSTGG